MSEESTRRSRPRERQAAPPAPQSPASEQPAPAPRPTPAPPPEVTERPDPRAVTDTSILRDQPFVAYALVFALLALLLICAFSIYMAAR
jgi:hypothetical protein